MNKESKDKQKRIEEEEVESQEWLDSLDYVIDAGGVERAAKLIKKLQIHAQKRV
jgi:pyruvate dehydrogenase complex dehydrogenase (E1) component